MTSDTKSEIVIVAVAGVFLWWLWHKNRAAGAGTGLNVDLPAFAAQPGVQGASFNVPAPLPGDIFQYSGSPTANPPPVNFALNPGSASCSCGTTMTDNTFGSFADLSAWLQSQPVIAAINTDAINSWY